MSHFIVLVRLPAVETDLTDALAKALLPYKESGCGDEDPPGLAQYLVFHDREEECLNDYQTKTTEAIELADGTLVSRYDKLYYDSWNHKTNLPQGAKEKEVPFTELYPTFEAYLEGWEGLTKDPTNGKYGYWKNPNQKWDWYAIGGRWSNYLPTTDGKVNFCRIEQLDFDSLAKEQAAKAKAFYEAYQKALVEGVSQDWFGWDSNVRDRAVATGLVKVVNPKDLTGQETRTATWPRDANKIDVLTPISEADFYTKWASLFNPIKPWATVDAQGWHEQGKMGWWACSDATTESTYAFANGFMDWLKSGDTQDWLVAVDCHI